MKLSIVEARGTQGEWEKAPSFMIQSKRTGDYVCRMDSSEGEQWRYDRELICHYRKHFEKLRTALREILPLWDREDVADEWTPEFTQIESILRESEEVEV